MTDRFAIEEHQKLFDPTDQTLKRSSTIEQHLRKLNMSEPIYLTAERAAEA